MWSGWRPRAPSSKRPPIDWTKVSPSCRPREPVAKLFATEAGNAAADAAIQALGGYGYTREYEVEKIRRDVRITTIYEGTSEIMQWDGVTGSLAPAPAGPRTVLQEDRRFTRSLAPRGPQRGG